MKTRTPKEELRFDIEAATGAKGVYTWELVEEIMAAIERYEQVNSVDLADVGGSLPDTDFAKQLLEVRDQLVYGNLNEAYHVLCKAADPDLTTVNHWEKWEKIAGQ